MNDKMSAMQVEFKKKLDETSRTLLGISTELIKQEKARKHAESSIAISMADLHLKL